MKNFEFLSYEPVVNEKFIGIATVRAWSKIILKYKVIPNKDNSGFFVAASSIKNGTDPVSGKDKYESVFMVDSSYENKELMAMLKDRITDCIAGKTFTSTVPAQDDECPF